MSEIKSKKVISYFDSQCLKIASLIATFMVVYRHGFNHYLYDIDCRLFYFIKQFQFVTNFFTGIAVPFFFLISGYLFFFNLDKIEDFAKKLKTRISTLLLPFILWNVLLMLTMLICYQIPITQKYVIYLTKLEYSLKWFVENLTYAPIVGQFWYVRDLILFSLISPLIWYTLRYRVLYAAILIFLFYRWQYIDTSVFSSEGILFFYAGAILGYEHISLFPKNRKWIWLKVLVALAFLGVTCFYSAHFYSLYVIFGIIAYVTVIASLSRLESLKDKLLFFAPFAFFLYAIHAPMGGIIKHIFVTAAPKTWLMSLAEYLIVPLFVIIIGISIGIALKKLFPWGYNKLSGGR